MANTGDILIKKKKYGDEEIDVIYRKLKPRPKMHEEINSIVKEGRMPVHLKDGYGNMPELNPRTYQVCPGIICQQDVEIVLRDGAKTYADVFRPEGDVKVPAIIAWSWFGKRPCADTPGVEFQTIGVPEGSCSPNAKFEGADPEYWCHKGYAVVNYDHRGVNNSEGDVEMTPQQEGIDAYDVIEFIAAQDWCTGKVAMGGNSGLAVASWKAASMQPPHLACIAPWEGQSDIYREMICMGGIPECGFNPYLTGQIFGTGYMEDHYMMAKKYPTINGYWEDKIAKLENIEVPAYITAGWNHFHLRGGTLGFRKIASKKKWIRIHREFEWPDQYKRENIRDLTDFYDRYLKGIRNGWESTPAVRLDVMDAYDFDFMTQRPENEFPLARTVYKKLWLNAADGLMNWEKPEEESSVRYESTKGRTTFDLRFDEDTELTGYMKLHLWVEADGSDDMDLFIAVQKLDAEGNWVPTYVLGKPHPGSAGKLRVSMRELDEEKSTDFQPYHTYKTIQKLKPGEIVPVDIEIWPTSRFWHAGEQIRVEIMGHYERIDWFEPFNYDTYNNGDHIIHTGGKYDSFLQIPVIPPKYSAGTYKYY